MQRHSLTTGGRLGMAWTLALLLAGSASAAPPAEQVGASRELVARSLVSMGEPSRLQHLLAKARRGEPLVIAVIGGSITQGASATTAENRYGNLVARCESPAATITEALLNLFDCWYDSALFDSRLEFAMRTWSLTDASVAAAMSRADEIRVAAITGLFRRFGYGATEADTRARTLYLTQVGYIALRSDEDLQVRMDRVPPYVLTFCGVAPSAVEVAAFRNRHGAI